ncbi:hypothetical protein FGLOB1_9064 [Fusarium globosum]|uniref:Apple domain-containing protein n=1 Tax=Fusarium globosum TaxID=78864 RepID=A0A8H5Y0P4_9HYPO|nr:hypothetical protein FGLOB1_9064 [Fusarium globosum]
MVYHIPVYLSCSDFCCARCVTVKSYDIVRKQFNSNGLHVAVTGGQTIIASELSSTSDLSSFDVATTEAQTGSGTLSFGSITEPVDTSSAFATDISSSALPTSTGIIEPPGRSVIFLIQASGNQKRDVEKREAEGFVGADNPDLFVGGLPTFYAGENYKALGVQDGGSFPQDAITRTFGTTGQNLIFKNSGLPNGEAVTQCQNVRLVGFETSISALASSTEASTAESVSSGIFSSEEPTTAETAAPTEFSSHSYVETSSTLPETSASSQTFGSVSSAASSRSVDASTSASGTGVFSTISSEEIIPPTSTFSSKASTTVTSQDANTSTSVSSQAVDSETSTIVSSEIFDSSVTIQSTLSSSDSSTEAPSSTELETSSSLASTSEEPSSTTTETSGDSTSETSSELASSSSEETTSDQSTTTSESSTGITTTTADTTTDLITTTTSAAAWSECRSDSNPYSDSGSTFYLSCDFSVDSGASIGVVQANSFNQCVFFCAQASNCAAIQYEKSTMNCSGFGSFTGTSANAQFDVAVKQP